MVVIVVVVDRREYDDMDRSINHQLINRFTNQSYSLHQLEVFQGGHSILSNRCLGESPPDPPDDAMRQVTGGGTGRDRAGTRGPSGTKCMGSRGANSTTRPGCDIGAHMIGCCITPLSERPACAGCGRERKTAAESMKTTRSAVVPLTMLSKSVLLFV